jgi:peroxiredoxin
MRKSELSYRIGIVFMSGALSTTACKDSPRTTAESARGAGLVAWAPPVSLTNATGGGAAPVFATSPSGHMALAWVSAPNGGRDGRLYVRPRPNDAASIPATELRDSLGSMSIYGEVPPKVAFGPHGSLYAAYLVTKIVPGMRWPQNALRFAVSEDGGAHWGAPATVTGDKVFGSYDDHALHVAPDGTIYLSWLAEVSHDTSHTFFARSTDGGTTWSKPAVIDPDLSCPCCRTAMASGADGSLYVAWRKRFAGAHGEERDIVVAKSVDHGATWATPVRVHVDAWQVSYCPDAGPSVKVARDGTIHIAWWTGKEGRAGTQYARSTDGGATFSPPVELGLGQHSRAAHIQLALGAGDSTVVAAWDDGTRQVPQIVVRVSTDGGRSFGPPDVVSADASQAGYPVVTLQRDTILLAWQERSLAAAAADSAASAQKDKNDPSTYVNALGAMQIVMRRGVMSASSGARSASNEGAFRPLAVGEAVPPYAIRTLAGDSVRLGGAQPMTVLNVWATWCTSCREEMADLNALQREFHHRGIRVVGVSVDESDETRVRRFADDQRLRFAVAHDRERRIQQLYKVVGVPETIVIGKEGRVLWRNAGNLHPVIDSVRAVLAREAGSK